MYHVSDLSIFDESAKDVSSIESESNIPGELWEDIEDGDQEIR